MSTPTSGFVFIAQLRDWLPDPIAHCLWFAYGPASTSCFIPIYAGSTELPERWCQPANFSRVDREQPQWNFRLVHNLTHQLRYQDAIKNVREMVLPAEQQLRNKQTALEHESLRILEEQGLEAASSRLNDHVALTIDGVADSYDQLVDYLIFKYLVGELEFAPLPLPRLSATLSDE